MNRENALDDLPRGEVLKDAIHLDLPDSAGQCLRGRGRRLLIDYLGYALTPGAAGISASIFVIGHGAVEVARGTDHGTVPIMRFTEALILDFL